MKKYLYSAIAAFIIGLVGAQLDMRVGVLLGSLALILFCWFSAKYITYDPWVAPPVEDDEEPEDLYEEPEELWLLGLWDVVRHGTPVVHVRTMGGPTKYAALIMDGDWRDSTLEALDEFCRSGGTIERIFSTVGKGPDGLGNIEVGLVPPDVMRFIHTWVEAMRTGASPLRFGEAPTAAYEVLLTLDVDGDSKSRAASIAGLGGTTERWDDGQIAEFMEQATGDNDDPPDDDEWGDLAASTK